MSIRALQEDVALYIVSHQPGLSEVQEVDFISKPDQTTDILVTDLNGRNWRSGHTHVVVGLLLAVSSCLHRRCVSQLLYVFNSSWVSSISSCMSFCFWLVSNAFLTPWLRTLSLLSNQRSVNLRKPIDILYYHRSDAYFSALCHTSVKVKRIHLWTVCSGCAWWKSSSIIQSFAVGSSRAYCKIIYIMCAKSSVWYLDLK